MAGQASCGGKSILEMLWDELMNHYGELVQIAGRKERCEESGNKVSDETLEDYGTVKGECLGLGTAIAIIVNPYNPNIDAVRTECVRRYEESR